MTSLGFLKDFKKTVEKNSSVSIGIKKPGGWWSLGNYALNKALSGSYFRGIPIGRLCLFAGPSGSGKSFISSNAMKYAQKIGAHILVLDSENALDIEYLSKIGVDISEEKLTYVAVDTIEDVNDVCSAFFKRYEEMYGRDNPDSPKVLIVLDSLAMLSTTTEQENYNKAGEIKSDQGIRAKRSKSMLRMILKRIARLPIAFIATDHVYPQDIMTGDGAWAITNSTKFSASIIGIVTKLKLKEGTEITGVRMRFETYKSRFAKIGTKIELEVPYNKGMSSYSGLIEMLESEGHITKAGNGYTFNNGTEDIKFYEKNLTDDFVENQLLKMPSIQKQEQIAQEEIDAISNLIDEEEQTEETA